MHYMALRQHDRRELQDSLTSLGLSSLGRCESHVMSSISSVLKLLELLEEGNESSSIDDADGFMKGRSLLETHTKYTARRREIL